MNSSTEVEYLYRTSIASTGSARMQAVVSNDKIVIYNGVINPFTIFAFDHVTKAASSSATITMTGTEAIELFNEGSSSDFFYLLVVEGATYRIIKGHSQRIEDLP